MCVLFERFYTELDTSGDKDALLKEVEALFLSALSMTVLPMVQTAVRPKLDYVVKAASDMDLIADAPDKPARMGISRDSLFTLDCLDVVINLSKFLFFKNLVMFVLFLIF